MMVLAGQTANPCRDMLTASYICPPAAAKHNNPHLIFMRCSYFAARSSFSLWKSRNTYNKVHMKFSLNRSGMFTKIHIDRKCKFSPRKKLAKNSLIHPF